MKGKQNEKEKSIHTLKRNKKEIADFEDIISSTS